MVGGQKRLAWHRKLQILSFRDTSRFKGYRLIAKYDIGHKSEFLCLSLPSRNGAEGRKIGASADAPDNVTRAAVQVTAGAS
jgi:hypothetical protein